MSSSGDFWKQVRKQGAKNNPKAVQIGQIISVNPLSINYQGIDISKDNGDTIYYNEWQLFDEKTFTQAIKPTCSDGTITENHTSIINDITSFLVQLHNTQILKVGDYVAIQELGNHTYIVLNKVISND